MGYGRKMAETNRAIHEAGHAVMALLGGIPVYLMAVGRCAAPYEGVCLVPGMGTIRRLGLGWDVFARSLIGGDSAERIHRGDINDRLGTDDDYAFVARICDELGLVTGAQRSIFCDAQFHLAVRTLTEPANWQLVLELAREVEARGQLDDRQVRDIFTRCRKATAHRSDQRLTKALAAARRHLLNARGSWQGLQACLAAKRPPVRTLSHGALAVV